MTDRLCLTTSHPPPQLHILDPHLPPLSSGVCSFYSFPLMDHKAHRITYYGLWSIEGKDYKACGNACMLNIQTFMLWHPKKQYIYQSCWARNWYGKHLKFLHANVICKPNIFWWNKNSKGCSIYCHWKAHASVKNPPASTHQCGSTSCSNVFTLCRTGEVCHAGFYVLGSACGHSAHSNSGWWTFSTSLPSSSATTGSNHNHHFDYTAVVVHRAANHYAV